MRALVTGATGHLGLHLVRRLVRDGHEVAALVRPTSDLTRLADVRERIDLVHGDFSDAGSLAAAVATAAPGVVFHLGWFGVTGPDRVDVRQVELNVVGGFHLVDAAVAAGCETWIGLGSQAEYGRVDGVLTETTPLRPTTLYGAAKVALGALAGARAVAGGMRAVWVRLLATYGPYDDERHLIPSVILTLLRGERPELTPGEQRWDYLFVEDAVDALVRLAITPTANGAFVLGAGTDRKSVV